MTVHGGDVWNLPDGVLDFSANVNPRGLPACARERLLRDAADGARLRRYPDRQAGTLRRALSERWDVPEEAIAIGQGAEALIGPGLRAMAARRVLVPVPAFSEYRRACTQCGVEFVPFLLERAQCFRAPVEELWQRAGECGAVLLNNPHNPSGALLTRGEVLRVLESGARVLLDEAFIDYAAHASVTREAAAHERLIVLRSLTKFYGCPGLRVGCAVAHPDTVRAISQYLPAWPVTQLAIDALASAVTDSEYAETSLRENVARRERLRAGLESPALRVFPSAANYLLVELGEGIAAAELRARLIERHGILIRNCDSYEGLDVGRFVRVAVLGEEENERLLAALAAELTR